MGNQRSRGKELAFIKISRNIRNRLCGDFHRAFHILAVFGNEVLPVAYRRNFVVGVGKVEFAVCLFCGLKFIEDGEDFLVVHVDILSVLRYNLVIKFAFGTVARIYNFVQELLSHKHKLQGIDSFKRFP